MATIYLAGAINPKIPRTYEWRKEAEKHLAYFDVLSPLRGKAATQTDTHCIATEGLSSFVMDDKQLVQRDYVDVHRADLILVNMDTYWAERPLTGTMFELAWAYANGTPVFAFDEGYTPFYLSHPFIDAAVTTFFPSLNEAIDNIRRFWNV